LPVEEEEALLLCPGLFLLGGHTLLYPPCPVFCRGHCGIVCLTPRLLAPL